MENILSIDSLKNGKNILKLKSKIFSKTLNLKHNLNIKDYYILQIQPYLSNKNYKSKIKLKEECITTELTEYIDKYYSTKKIKEILFDIIKNKVGYINNKIYPIYINLEKFFYEKMYKYVNFKKQIKPIIIDNNLNNKNKKRKYYDFDNIKNNEFMNEMRDEGIKKNNRKISKKQSIKFLKKKEKNHNKKIILIKATKFDNINNYNNFIENRENFCLINNIEKSINKINNHNNNLKIKATNIFYNILMDYFLRIKLYIYKYFMYKLTIIFHRKKKASENLTLIMPIIKQKFNNDNFKNRHTLNEKNKIIPILLNIFNKNKQNNDKNKFKPFYFFNKKFKKDIFNDFYKDWNNNKNNEIIDSIYKYTSENFNKNQFNDINKLIKNNKLDKIQTEVNNKTNTIFTKFKTISHKSNNKFRNKTYKKPIKLFLNINNIK